MVWFSNDYRITTEGVLSEESFEVVCKGRKIAFICYIDNMDKYNTFDEFITVMKSKQIKFDSDKMSIEFNDIFMDYNVRFVNGVKQSFPYEKLFDSPYLKSEYNSAIFEVTDGENRKVYDFNF